MLFKVSFIWLFLLLILSSNQENKAFTSKKDSPNIIILFPDDMGYGDTSYNGHPTIHTPNLDLLASQGLKLTNFYSGSPACSASRYTMLTGKYPNKSGFDWVLYPKSERGLHPKEITIAEALKHRGYATAMFGKWHLGSTKNEYLPKQNGFDTYVGLPYSNDMIPPKWPDIPLFQDNDTLELNPDQSQLTKLYTEKAIQFMETNKKKPFFIYLPYAMPHVPLYASETFKGKSKRGLYGDVIEEIDWSVGEIRAALEKLNLDKNTVIFFASDNGPWIIKGLKGGSAGLFKDGKGSTWEGGMRVPGIVYWPGTIKPNSSGAISAVKDIYPTILSIIDDKTFKSSKIDGNDLSYLWQQNKTYKRVEKPFFYYGLRNELFAVRKGAWKLHVKTNSQTKNVYFNNKTPLLFNINIDPSETKDLTQEYPEIVIELSQLIDKQLVDDKAFVNYFDQ